MYFKSWEVESTWNFAAGFLFVTRFWSRIVLLSDRKKKTVTHGINRRDFVNGIAVGAGAGLLSPALLYAGDELTQLPAMGFKIPPDYYPPNLDRAAW